MEALLILITGMILISAIARPTRGAYRPQGSGEIPTLVPNLISGVQAPNQAPCRTRCRGL